MKVLFVFLIFLSNINAIDCKKHLQYGIPSKSDQILCREGYVIGYNYSRKAADWVVYRLTPNEFDGDEARLKNFRPDESIPEQYQVLANDYDEPIYELGHLVSAESQDGSKTLMSETFIISNVLPQLPTFNKGIWKGLENRERKWAKSKKELFIYIGVLYEGDKIKYLKGKIPIATHYFKIFYSPQTNEVLSYLIPHKKLYTKDLDKYLTTIDDIEVRSGLNFLSSLEWNKENKLESKKATLQWN